MRGYATASILAVALGPLVAFHAVQPAAAANSSGNPGNCKVVEQDASKDNTGSTGVSTSVTAGGGSVSARTTGPGNSVTVRSGDGSSSSVAAAAGSGGSTVVTGANGDCTIYVKPGNKENTK